MDMNTDQLIEHAVRDGVREGIKQRLSNSYGNPLDKIVEQAFANRAADIRKLLDEGIASCMSDEDFREGIRSSVRSQLAKILVQRFGGELEKQINTLKSDPITRARITMAIEEIVKTQATVTA